MSLGSLQGVGRTAPLETASRSPDSDQPSKPIPTIVEIDASTQQPKLPRFPWLSRLARELESASGKQPPYGSVPITGENLDSKA